MALYVFSSVIRVRTASLLAFEGIQTHKQMLSTPMTSVFRVQHQLLHCQAISRQVCVTTYKKNSNVLLQLSKISEIHTCCANGFAKVN